jgi:hypothetical protein
MRFLSTKVVPWRVALLLVLLVAAFVAGLWIYHGVAEPETRLVEGMSFEEVRSILGDPGTTSSFGEETRWTYSRSAAPGFYLVFRNGELVGSSFKGVPRFNPDRHG